MASTSTVPSTMRAWLYATPGPFEQTLHLEKKAPMPPPLKKGQLLIQVISASINPADYKVPEMGPFVIRYFARLPASPGMDFCGRVAAVGEDAPRFQTGQLVYGCLGTPAKYGSLAEYMICDSSQAVALPEGVDPDVAPTAGVAGQTAYQTLVPYVSRGDKVLITAGAGGCGNYSIQFAKLLGCHVTTTCSKKNIQYCKDLGADEVIDYTSQDVAQVLKSSGKVYSLVVDYTGLPANLYRESHHFMLPGKTFVQIGASSMWTMVSRTLLPAILGGGKTKFHNFMMKNSQKDLAEIGEYLKEGKVKVNLNIFDFDDAMKAFGLLHSGQTRGKIVLHVSEKP